MRKLIPLVVLMLVLAGCSEKKTTAFGRRTKADATGTRESDGTAEATDVRRGQFDVAGRTPAESREDSTAEPTQSKEISTEAETTAKSAAAIRRNQK